MDADRIVLPIPPGVHWRDVKPIEIRRAESGTDGHQLEGPAVAPAAKRKRSAPVKDHRLEKPTNGMKFEVPRPNTNDDAKADQAEKQERKERVKKPAAKIDPQFVSAARELRDRYLEQVNENGYRLESAGKYDLKKSIVDGRESIEKTSLLSTIDYRPSTDQKLLDAA